MAGPHQLAAILRLRRQPIRMRRPLPLLDEPLALLLERHRQRAHRLLQRRMVPFADPDRQRELPHRHSAFNLRHNLAGGAFSRAPQVVDAPQVDLAHHRHVPVRRRPKLPIHLEVLHQVLPAVARAHKPAAHAREPAARRHHQRPLVLPRQQHVVPGQVHRPRRVPRPAAIQMRRQQRIQLQPRHQVLVRPPAAPCCSTTPWCGSQIISLVRL